MNNILKRSFALLLALFMCLSVLPLQTLAAENATVAADYLSKCTKYGTYVLLEAANSTDYIKTLPCSAATDSSSKDVRRLHKGETLASTAIYKNSAGNLWYYVTTTDGKSGYIFGETAKFSSIAGNAVISDIKLGTTTPKRGSGVAITGSVSTTSLGTVTINSVTGVLKDAQGATQTKTITTGFSNISKTALNNDLKFGSLCRGPGSLTITIKCSTRYIADGTTMGTKSAEAKQTLNFTVQDTYKVIYNANGGSDAPASQTKTYGKNLTLTSSVPTRTHYTFLGWSTNKSATSATYAAGGTLKTDVYSGDITLYAVWKYTPPANYLDRCTKYGTYLLLEAANSTDYIKTLPCSSSTDASSKNVRQLTKGETLAALEIYKNTAGNYWYKVITTNGEEGYIFGEAATFTSIGGNAVLSDVTIATTTPKRGSSVDIGGSLSTTALGTVTIDSVTGVLKDALGNTQSKTITSGYGDISKTALNTDLKFANLCRGPGSLTITATGSCKYIANGTTLGTKTTEVKQTLNFTVQDTYQVIYNANGGSNAPAAQTKTYGKNLTLTTSVPTRSGYSFLGWSTSKSATSAAYAAGATLKTDVYSGDITLYAVWKQNEVKLIAPTLKASNVASTGKIKLSWNKVDGAAKYQIVRSLDNKNWEHLAYSTGTSATNTKTDAGKTYYYKIRAIDANGNKSAYSNIVSRMCDLPRPTLSVSNVASTGKIKLSWSKIEGATKYQIVRSLDNQNWEHLAYSTGTTATNTKTDAGKTYYYKIRAIHSNSSANSAYSAVVSRTCDLAQPKAQIKLNTKGKPLIYWAAVEGAVEYKVYIYDANGKLLNTATLTNVKITHTSAVPGTTYKYRVEAIHSNSAANSAKSNLVSIKSK